MSPSIALKVTNNCLPLIFITGETGTFGQPWKIETIAEKNTTAVHKMFAVLNSQKSYSKENNLKKQHAVLNQDW